MPLALVNTSIPATHASCKRAGFGNKSSAVSLKPARVWPVVRYPSGGSRPAKYCIKALVNTDGALKKEDSDVLTKDELEDLSGHKPHNIFPPNFVFGAASAAFQVEGATKEGGRGPSIWDTFCEKFPGKIADQSSGDPASGSYYHYKEDVQLLAEIGLNAYRFSISWSRILPKGRGTPNEEGIAYYNKLIDELIHNGIQPFVTLFHWDLPQALEDEYGGFLSRKVVEDYKNYAKLCFERFGDRVKHWTTLNEPYSFSHFGYNDGSQAPGHCTPDLEVDGKKYLCPVGDSLREPYTVAHHLLLAHAEAVSLYRENYKEKFGGQIGVTLVTHWFEPYDNLPASKEAQHRALESVLGWFFDPIKYGNYPFSMRALVGERLPIFTPEESAKLKDSFDFVGINYYTARYARDQSDFNYTVKPKCSNDDSWAEWLVDKGDVPIGPAEKNSWVNVYPKGLRKLLLYIKDRYRNPPIYITENGAYSVPIVPIGQSSKKPISIPAPIDDIFRTEYHTSHLHELENALSSRANVKGYFVWSLLDSFEWDGGYTCRFGLNQVDFKNPDLTRRPKQSSLWLKRFLKNVNPQPSDQVKPLPDAVETVARQVPVVVS